MSRFFVFSRWLHMLFLTLRAMCLGMMLSNKFSWKKEKKKEEECAIWINSDDIATTRLLSCCQQPTQLTLWLCHIHTCALQRHMPLSKMGRYSFSRSILIYKNKMYGAFVIYYFRNERHISCNYKYSSRKQLAPLSCLYSYAYTWKWIRKVHFAFCDRCLYFVSGC